MKADWIDHHSTKSLKRLLARLLEIRRINMLRRNILSVGTILGTKAVRQLGRYGFVWLDCGIPSHTGGSR
ncbi:MAG: hypothetical protein WCF40_07075 [Desulfobacterales bacterium]|jgi:hypothetical protein